LPARRDDSANGLVNVRRRQRPNATNKHRPILWTLPPDDPNVPLLVQLNVTEPSDDPQSLRQRLLFQVQRYPPVQ
jgi:hypothetical protein